MRGSGVLVVLCLPGLLLLHSGQPVRAATEDSAVTEAKNDDVEPAWSRWLGKEFLDTRVTFVLSDDNVLAGAADRSPSLGMQNQDAELFMEGLDQEKRGRETETQLVLYKRASSFFPSLDAEAALVIEMENWVDRRTWRNQTQLGDDGSYLKVNYRPRGADAQGDAGEDTVSLTLFPMDSQRFLLGYLYDIAWGGERIFPNNTGQVPGARLKYDWNVGGRMPGYGFVGAKTARLLNEQISEPQTYYGFLTGFGVSLSEYLMWEGNGGYFQRGAFPPQGVVDGAQTAIGGKTVEAYGASTRLTLHRGAPIAQSVDFRLYKYHNKMGNVLLQSQSYDQGWALTCSAELTSVFQSLLRWNRPDSAQLQPAVAGAVVAKARWRAWRIHLDYVYRQLSYVVLDIPGVAPFKAFPRGADVGDEWFVAGGVDLFIEALHLTPGVILGYKRPATWSTDAVTTVIKSSDDWETLPAGQNAFDILSGKVTLRWDLAHFFAVLGEIRYVLDKNATKFVKTSDTEAPRLRVFEQDRVTNQLGFSLLAQARW